MQFKCKLVVLQSNEKKEINKKLYFVYTSATLHATPLQNNYMNKKAQFLLEFTLQEGQQESFKKQLDEVIPFIENSEPGALIYEFYFNEDNTKCYVLEQYYDSAAFMTHLVNVSTRLQELLKISSITRLEILGDLSPEAHAFAESLGAKFYNFHGGFARA